MIVILKHNPAQTQVDKLLSWLRTQGYETNLSVGKQETIIGLIGDTSGIDIDLIRSLEVVDDVKRITEPYKNANRKFHSDDSIIDIGEGLKIGGGHFCVIAGPCSVESREQVTEIAKCVKAAGANLLRGGAFKPRTSPYSFQGLRAEGLELLLEAKEATGLPIVSEVMDASHLPLFADVDIIQVGARNMQNFELLHALGSVDKPILLKRGLANTIQELLMSAEHIMASGNPNVILCERGIRTFETATRNTFDISAVPVLHRLSHLPVVVDPSHATGESWLVHPIAVASAAIGADGIMIEVHNDPPNALCDGAQALTCEAFADAMWDINAVRTSVFYGREVARP